MVSLVLTVSKLLLVLQIRRVHKVFMRPTGHQGESVNANDAAEALTSDCAKRGLKSRSAAHRLQVMKEKVDHQCGCKLAQRTHRRNIIAAARWREEAKELKRFSNAL